MWLFSRFSAVQAQAPHLQLPRLPLCVRYATPCGNLGGSTCDSLATLIPPASSPILAMEVPSTMTESDWHARPVVTIGEQWAR